MLYNILLNLDIIKKRTIFASQTKTIINLKLKVMKTYDVYFNDAENSNNKGFRASFEEAKSYIERYNGTNNSYFEDYKGGTVSIVCNETGETVYEEAIR